jgi:hypothetical protein
MKQSICLTLGLAASAIPAAAQERSGRVQVGAGFFVPTDLRVDGDSAEAEPGVLVGFRIDRPVAPTLDAGLFLQVGSLTAGDRDEQVNFFTFGAAISWLTALNPKATLRLGGDVGYRRQFADLERYDRINAVALNGHAILSYAIDRRFTGVVEAGVLTQPFGSNGDHEVMWLPFPYLMLGAEF